MAASASTRRGAGDQRIDPARDQRATLNTTLTLPGIAGFVLTIGAAVDANVLINERIREERKRGRKVHRRG